MLSREELFNKARQTTNVGTTKTKITTKEEFLNKVHTQRKPTQADIDQINGWMTSIDNYSNKYSPKGFFSKENLMPKNSDYYAEQASELQYMMSDEYKTEIEEDRKRTEQFAEILDRYKRSKWDEEKQSNNLNPLTERVVDIYSIYDELNAIGVNTSDLTIEGDVTPEKVLEKFEKQLYAKYDNLVSKVQTYDATMNSVRWQKKIEHANEVYKSGKSENYNEWVSAGKPDFSANRFTGLEYEDLLDENERTYYNVKYYEKKKKGEDTEAFEYEFQDILAQRQAMKDAEELYGDEWGSLWYTFIHGMGDALDNMNPFSDDEPDASVYARPMIGENIRKTSGEGWGIAYDVTGQVADQLPEIGVALATQGLSKYATLTKLRTARNVVKGSMADDALKAIANTKAAKVGNLTYKAAMGVSVSKTAYTEMKRLGYTDAEAGAYAALNAGLEIFLTDFLGGMGRFSGKLTNSSINAMANNINNAFVRFSTSSLIRGGGEFIEESIQAYAEPLLKRIVTGDLNIPLAKSGDVFYSGMMGLFTSLAFSVPSGVSTAVSSYKNWRANGGGFTLTKKGIKNLSISNELYSFANSMPEDTLSNKMAQVVRKKGTAYNMLSELAHLNMPLTSEQSQNLHDRLVEDGYSTELADMITEASVKVSEGKSIPKNQVLAIESNQVLSPALLDSIVKADAKTLGIENDYNSFTETGVLPNTKENVSTKNTEKIGENTAKIKQMPRTKVPKAKTDAVGNTPISDVVLKSTARNPLTAEQISDNEAIIQGIAKRMGGYEVIFSDENYTDENGVSAPGRIDKANKKIYISRNAKNPITWLFKHEMTHSTEFKKHYKEFVKSIQKTDVYKDWLRKRTGFNSSRQDLEAAANLGKMLQYSEQGVDLSVTGAQQENIADFVADMLFTDPNGLNTLLNQLETSQRNKVAQWLLDVIESIKSMFRGKQLREINALERKLRKLVTESKTVKTTDESKSAESVKHSLEEDSDGNQLSKEQQDFFKDSKMRDDNGNLKVMYHGSQNAGFHVFDNNFSDDFLSFFFTDKPEVAASYSGTRQIYAAQSIRTAKDVNAFIDMLEYDEYKVVETNGKFELLENNKHVAYSDTAQGIYEELCRYENIGLTREFNYEVYLNLKNPLVVDAGKRNWNNVSKEVSQELEDRYYSLTTEEKNALIELASWEDFQTFDDTILSALEQKSTGFVDEYYMHLASAVDKLGGNNININNLFSIASHNFSEDYIQDFAVIQMNTRDYAKKAKAEGYDGVIFKNIYDSGRFSNHTEGASTVAVAFESNQIKSVMNKKPTSDPDIRYSLEEDSDGNQLSKEQQEFFKDSVVRDKNGNLLVMYHGTDADFTEFDQSKIGTNAGATMGYGFYFTNKSAGGVDFEASAEVYGRNLLRGYVDIKNPLSVEKKTISKDAYLDIARRFREKNGIYGYPFTFSEIYDEAGSDYELYSGMTSRHSGENTDIGVVIDGFTALGFDGIIHPYGDAIHAVTFSSNQFKSVDNTNPTSNPDIRYSLEEMSPDSIVPTEELDSLYQRRNELENSLMELSESEDFSESEFNRINNEYKAVQTRIAKLESEISNTESGRLNSIDDTDAPPEIDAPYIDSDSVTAEDPFENRDIAEVGKREVKAYMYENPEVKPFFQDAAISMLGDLNDSTKGKRMYIPEGLPGSYGAESYGHFDGVKRHTTDDIAELLDVYGYTYAQIEKGLNAIIEDNGAENNAVSKRIEFMLNDRLMKGYTDIDGRPIQADQEYINLLKEKQITEYSEEAFNLTQTKVDNLETNTEDFTLESQSAKPSDQSSEYAEQMDSLGVQLRSGQITLDDYKNAIDALYKEAGQKHGTIKQGESVTGEENFNNPVPQSVGKGTKVRQNVRTVMEAPKNADISDVLDPALEAEILKGKHSFVPTSNKENIEKATKAIANGADYSTWYEKINGNGILRAEDIALGELLLQGALEQGDAGKALKLTAELSEVGTRLGQAVQAFSLLKRMGGLGKLLYVQQAVRTINRDLQMRFGNKKTTPQVKLKEDLAVQLAESKTESDFDIAYTAMLQDIASQIPSTFRDRWNAWRYMAMLANPTTIIRNFTGNVLFMPTMAISNTMSKTAQLFMRDTQKRTRTFTVPKRYKEFAEKSWQENRKALMSGGKYNMNTEIDDYRTIFKFKPLESVRKATNWALENKWFGDEAFMGNHYRRALGEVLAARKVDLNNISKETLAEAQKIAAERALKATYRDATVVAQALNMLSNQRGWGMLVEGVIPFKKTPINILKRGVEYSPLGLLNGVGKAIQLATKKGDMSATTVIDAFSNALTGTGLFILGMWFSSMGIASAGFDDEEELWRKLNGEQAYSLKFGDLDYTFDWMAPSSIPFFMGVASYEDAQRNTNESVGLTELVTSAAASGIDVMLETSMLQSVADLLANYRFTDSPTEGISNILASDVSSFIMQHFPTLFGKMANTLDDTRREFFVDKSKDGVGQFFDTMGEKISAKIPWLSAERLPYVNAWGEEESTGSVGQRIFQNFVSPGYISWDKSTELTDEISRLYKNTGNANVLPERAPKKIEFKDTKKVLTEDEYYDYSTRRGQKNADYLEELIAHKDYASLSDEQKAEIIEKLYKFSDAYAKSYLDYTYDDIVLMDIVDVDKATYDGYSKQTKTALAKAFFLKSYGDEMKIEKNGGSVVDEYIKESIKKAGIPKKEKKKENVDNVIKKYS